jgi:putative FmdB family regulatory protein
MPIYEYECKACGQCFEKLVLTSDQQATLHCPECGHAEVRKLMSCINAFDGVKSGLCTPGGSSGFS